MRPIKTISIGKREYHSNASYGQQLMWRIRGIQSLSSKDIRESPRELFYSLLDSCRDRKLDDVVYNLQNMLVLLEKACKNENYSSFNLTRKSQWKDLFEKHYLLSDISTLTHAVENLIDIIIQENPQTKKAHKIMKLFFKLNQPTVITLNKIERQLLFIKFKVNSKSFENTVEIFLEKLDKTADTRIEKSEILKLVAIYRLRKLMEISSHENEKENFEEMKISVKEAFVLVYDLSPTPLNKRNISLIHSLIYGVVWNGFTSRLKWSSESFHYDLLELMIDTVLDNITYSKYNNYSLSNDFTRTVTITQQYTRVPNIIQYIELMKYNSE